MKQYKTLDVFKILSAFLIIIIHTSPFASYSKVLTFGFRNIITIIAVPFFFACSGFITFSKLGNMDDSKEKDKYILKYLKRIGIMYLIWSAIYFVFVVYKWIQEPFSYLNILEYIRDFFFEGSYQTIWFLPALFSATAIVYLLSKKISTNKIIFISIPFYCFALLGSSYFGITKNIAFLSKIFEGYYFVFKTIKNGLLFGFIYVAIGAWLASDKEKMKLRPRICLIFIVCSIIFLSAEAVILNYFNLNERGCDTIIMLIPMTISIMLFAINWEIKLSEKFCLVCRKYSLLMFLVQRLPMSIIDLFMENTIIVKNSLIYFLVVFVCTLLLSFIIIELSKKIKIIRYMY